MKDGTPAVMITGSPVRMTYDEFNEYCDGLPATTYVKQWGDSHVWKVGGKVFAVGGWEKTDQPAFVFKTSEADYFFLQEEDGFQPAPYMASRGMKWIQIYDSSNVSSEDIKSYLEDSHRIVSAGLSKKRQRELGLNC